MADILEQAARELNSPPDDDDAVTVGTADGADRTSEGVAPSSCHAGDERAAVFRPRLLIAQQIRQRVRR